MLDEALEYAKRGWAVFPLFPKSKDPVTKHGFKDATTDAEQIKQWFSKYPNNVGIATGKPSGNLLVIDLDLDEQKGKNGLDVLFKWEQEHGKLPETARALTGRGGVHLFFRGDGRAIPSSIDLYEGIDIRGDGGYVVAPPSIHPNGNAYEWEVDPDEIPIAEANDTVYRFLQGAKPQKSVEGLKVPDIIPEGARTTTLFKVTCSLQSKGLSDSAIKAAVEEMNRTQCNPPLTQKELDAEVFKALSRYDKGRLESVKAQLAYTTDSKGNKKIIQSVRNFETVLESDERFAGKICFDQFAQQAYLVGDVPWEHESNYRAWSSFDDSALFSILQSEYGLASRNDFYDALKNISRKNSFHPVRDMLDSLMWDEREHIRRLLPDFLGAEDSQYNYEVMRLWMLGAVARIYQPGCKFDYTIILQGKQGLGKSTFLQLLAVNDYWFNDSLDSLDTDKSAQSLMGSWIIELAELKSLARTAGGVDSVKRFLTAVQDKYRVPYERRADIFPRQCVFAGTTNKNDFLQDETGNRRFLIVQTGITNPTKNLFEPETIEEIRQAWAEAVHIYKTEHPRLTLPDSCRQIAEELQADSTSDDGKIGIISEFLKDKTRTCAIEIWRNALGEQGRPQKWQASEINNIVLGMPGWKRMPSPGKFGQFGSQRGFQRDCSTGFVNITDEQEDELPFT